MKENEITIIVPIKAKAEFREELRSKLMNLTTLTNQEAGNICYCLHQAEASPNQFIIYEQWKNQAALDFHMKQDYLKAFLEDSRTLLVEEIKGTICYQIS